MYKRTPYSHSRAAVRLGGAEMNNTSIQRTRRAALLLSRRGVVRGAAGIVALGGLLGSHAAPLAGSALVRAQGAEGTLTVASYGSPVDLDPHSAAEDRSALAIRAPTSSSSPSRGTRPTSTRASSPSGGKPTTTRASGPSIFGLASRSTMGPPATPRRFVRRSNGCSLWAWHPRTRCIDS